MGRRLTSTLEIKDVENWLEGPWNPSYWRVLQAFKYILLGLEEIEEIIEAEDMLMKQYPD